MMAMMLSTYLGHYRRHLNFLSDPRGQDLTRIILLGCGRQMKRVGDVKSNQERELQIRRRLQLAGQPLPALGKAARRKATF